jgi:hypothetical protein
MDTPVFVEQKSKCSIVCVCAVGQVGQFCHRRVQNHLKTGVTGLVGTVMNQEILGKIFEQRQASLVTANADFGELLPCVSEQLREMLIEVRWALYFVSGYLCLALVVRMSLCSDSYLEGLATVTPFPPEVL